VNAHGGPTQEWVSGAFMTAVRSDRLIFPIHRYLFLLETRPTGRTRSQLVGALGSALRPRCTISKGAADAAGLERRGGPSFRSSGRGRARRGQFTDSGLRRRPGVGWGTPRCHEAAYPVINFLAASDATSTTTL
jgi:hypothetical protein